MMENNCVNLYWNPSKIVGVLVRTKIWPSSVTLILGLPERRFQMAYPRDGEQLYQIILKPIHICRSYDPDKFEKQMDARTHTHKPNW